MLAVSVNAQTMKAQGPRGSKPVVIPQPAQPFNSAAKDTTPMNCEQYNSHPHPAIKPMCERMERNSLQRESAMQGRPSPSGSVVDLPAMGSAEAKASGYACVGGQAMRKLPNGWEQVMAPAGGWQRCRGG